MDPAEQIKKILCCSSLVSDLVLTLGLVNIDKLEEKACSPAAASFVAAAEALAASLE